MLKKVPKGFIPIFIAAALISFYSKTATSSPLPTLTTLHPGEFNRFEKDLDINIVLIGIHPGTGARNIDPERLLQLLPAFSSVSEEGSPNAVGSNKNLLPLYSNIFNLKYHVIEAPQVYEDFFFNSLKNYLAFPQTVNFAPFLPLPITLGQAMYDFCNQNIPPDENFLNNCFFSPPSGPSANSRNITQNYFLHTVSVEQFLLNTLPFIGVDTSKYTIVLMSGFDTPSLQDEQGNFAFDHSYFNADESDPDTGFYFGGLYARLMMAWGGTAKNDAESCPLVGGCSLSRLWFYDLSSSPDLWSGNWDLMRGEPPPGLAASTIFHFPNGIPDFRIPPIWEYGNESGISYRAFNDLTKDLAKVVDDVFINQLVNPYPIYSPGISPPSIPTKIQLDVNFFEGVQGFTASSARVKPALVVDKPNRFIENFTYENTDYSLTSQILSVLDCWKTALFDPNGIGESCFGNRLGGTSIADLYFYFREHLFQYLEGNQDYELPVFAWFLPDSNDVPLLGYADSNSADQGYLRQSFVYLFHGPQDSDPNIPLTQGYTHSLIHEIGHHLGLSHPHDGLKCLDKACSLTNLQLQDGSDDSALNWMAEESASVMGYTDLNSDFSQFDLDSRDRLLTSIYVNLSNQFLKQILTSPKATSVSDLLLAADTKAGQSMNAYENLHYREAVLLAREAYNSLKMAANNIQIKLEPTAWQQGYRAPPDVMKEIKKYFMDPTPGPGANSLRAGSYQLPMTFQLK